MINGRLGELLVILFITLVLFGAGRVPTIMRDLGRGLREFKKGFDSDYKDSD